MYALDICSVFDKDDHMYVIIKEEISDEYIHVYRSMFIYLYPVPCQTCSQRQ